MKQTQPTAKRRGGRPDRRPISEGSVWEIVGRTQEATAPHDKAGSDEQDADLLARDDEADDEGAGEDGDRT